MIDVTIPDFGRVSLTTLVCDYNGTLARDGFLLPEARDQLRHIARKLRVQLVTGDTFGTAHNQLQGIRSDIVVLPAEGEARAKAALVERLGASQVVAIGNGRNDRLMLGVAGLGIAVIGDEGAATEALQASDIVVRHIVDAFELLLDPRRLVATLRG